MRLTIAGHKLLKGDDMVLLLLQKLYIIRNFMFRLRLQNLKTHSNCLAKTYRKGSKKTKHFWLNLLSSVNNSETQEKVGPIYANEYLHKWRKN